MQLSWLALRPLFLCSLVLSASVSAQQAALPASTGVNQNQLTTLHGTVHPLARPESDQGVVADDFPVRRLLLQMARPADREQALQQFLSDAHTPGSASYHQWLTPEEFGSRFGARDEDTQVVTNWLESQGFTVARVAKGKTLIEFSGTAGQIRTALHTEIHRYNVQGETHYANASEIKIPAALAPLVGGFSPLNDFYAKPQIEVAGKALYAHDTKKTTPLWTLPNPYGTSNLNAYTVAPEDFYTQYDLAPLYKAGVNGTGQTIGIINESNINLSLVQAYQSFFGLTGNLPQVIIDGDDPGDLPSVDVEAYLDVELSGAVAPQANVNLYIAGASNLIDPLELAALRAVDDNQASVLSVSFGDCEANLGNAGNQFWAGLWEEAAAQGQTVFVSSGDTGSVCSPIATTVSVSGLTSTPWNVSVGGTDFYYSDYATGGASATSLWNQTNDSNFGSLIAPLPEQPWDDSFGFDVIADGFARNEYAAGGGGASSCSSGNVTTGTCTSGYAKPVWQTGPGVPKDGVRDLPDVSLFASNGANLSAYAICAFAGDCAAGSGNNAEVLLVGGTSASSPAMAGIMALINQRYGRQGQANYTLYPLAQQKPAAFHDITVGTNSFPCIEGGSETCVTEWNGIIGTSQYAAGPGYDQASGLGSVDANVLVNDWNSLTFRATTTSLQLSKSNVTHGTPINLSTTVAPSSGSGTPTGDVAILTNSTVPFSQSQTYISLSNGTGSSSVNYLPGGSYQVTARYGGDGSFASSTSAPETLTITPEKSNINFSVVSDYNNVLLITGGTVVYDMPLALMIQPTSASAKSGTSDGIATGTATFTIDSTTVTVALNAAGIATWTPPVLAVGTHTASASYSGDASYAASSSTSPVTFTVTPGETYLYGYLIGQYTYQLSAGGEEIPAYFMNPGGDLTLSVTVKGDSNSTQYPLGTPAPTGTVQICLVTYPGINDNCQYSLVTSQTVPLVPLSGAFAQESVAVATFTNLGPGADGYYFFNAVYSGDSVWGSGSMMDISPINIQTLPTYAPSTSVLSISPTSISGTQTAKVTATITGSGNNGTSPVGEIDFYNNDVLMTYCFWPANSGVAGSTTTCTFDVNPLWFNMNGANQLQTVYWGDQANGPSLSNVVNFTATQSAGDFMLAPQSPLITLQPGASGTVLLNLQSESNFNGTVAMSCTPSSTDFSCSVNSAVALNGAATATLVINATEQTAALVQPMRSGQAHWPMAAGMLAFVLFLTGGKARRNLVRNLLLGFALVVAFSVSGCGGGSSGGGKGGGGNNTPAGTYNVVVTATANGIVHNTKITVIVP
jgi:subtilase family serine protease